MAANFYFCRVESVFDENDGLRIKVRIPTIDPLERDDPGLKRVPYAFPLLPKHLHVNPRVGEMVLVFLHNPNAPKGGRFFIGPIISQQYMLDYDPYNYSAQVLTDGSQIGNALPIPSMNPENIGSVPDRNDIVIQGRQNCEVALKPSELRLRCGFKLMPDAEDSSKRLLNNPLSPAYIQMKYKRSFSESGRMQNTNGESDTFKSEINIVADRINILSHDSSTYFNLTDREELINKEELKKIYELAHPLPYGDDLMELLREIIRIFLNHTHPYAMLPPALNASDKNVLNRDLTKLLSKSVRIN